MAHKKIVKMRIDIKTKGKVTDKDLRALYILNEAMKTSTERMRKHNLQFIAEKYGFTLYKTKDQ